MPGLRGRRPRAVHRLALSPSSWGVSENRDWGHQIDVERVLSEAAAVGEGAITAGPPGFLPDRSDHARSMLRRHRLRVVAGQVHAIPHHNDIRGPELAHIDGHAHWLAAVGAETLVLAAIPERGAGAASDAALSNAQWAHLLHLVGSVEHVCARHRLRLAVQPRFASIIQGPKDIERLLVGSEAGVCLDVGHLVIAGADPVEVVELAVLARGPFLRGCGRPPPALLVDRPPRRPDALLQCGEQVGDARGALVANVLHHSNRGAAGAHLLVEVVDPVDAWRT